jgi:uncharacterized protein (DUF302 family)
MATARQTSYGFGKTLPLPYPEALERTKAALKEQGFGVLMEIDVQQTMKEKLGVDFRPYTILGACNPPLAHRALSTELDIGLLLPCNVVVYEADGGSIVQVLDPAAALGIVGNPALHPIAHEAQERLRKAVDSLPG